MKEPEVCLKIPQMLLIGASGRNQGKTTLAYALIKQWKKQFPIVGLKVTAVTERDGCCPRGGSGCGVCSSLAKNYELIEETNDQLSKDTSRLLAAGAEKVYWLRTLKSNLAEGIASFIAKVSPDTLIVCESNSLRNVVQPGGFILLHNAANAQLKPSALAVLPYADLIIEDGFEANFAALLPKLQVNSGETGLTVQITAC